MNPLKFIKKDQPGIGIVSFVESISKQVGRKVDYVEVYKVFYGLFLDSDFRDCAMKQLYYFIKKEL